ncbi:hypothetical protein SAMN05216330_104464 [Bradyrhizobium sp. Ghvi]|uniref:hypothetical protein n=1 Tax=Bradyrhizobium sp. Ghvi TaxID=1855319 RepID=UPI0008EEEFB5|nr:hypothetical protein [Bradyrhizobium sp. Ghvi]SFO74478.1 hypothetical protein SAMN05216330_104464 [Bradyrhizobium sp. Ghvi]
MRKAADNLTSLHGHEEDIRTKSVSAIHSDSGLCDHWSMLAEAMDVTYAFSHDHMHGSENELTLQYLGIRLFNAAGGSIKLALSGYYQHAFHLVRDVIETYFLVDYLSTYPSKIDEWKRADKKKRISHFGPGVIRNALDLRDGSTIGERKRVYDLISEAASHASYPGILLTTTGPSNLAIVGPFYDDRKLTAWLYEIALRFSHAALILVSQPEGKDLKLLAARAHYLSAVHEWWSKYRGLKPSFTP